MVVAVTPSGGVSGGDAIAGAVDDLGDGTYACSYVVPSRGDYDVAVTLDGDAIRGSPFPVFFAAPPASNVPANPMTASAVAGVAAARPPAAAAVQPATRYPPPPPPPAALDEMQRTLCVKNIGAMVGVEQLRALFGYCGDVVDCRVAGSGAQYGFVEFATNAQAVKALGLDGMALGDRTIKVEMSRTVRMNAPAAPPRGPNLVVPPPPPTTTTGGAAPTAPAPPRRRTRIRNGSPTRRRRRRRCSRRWPRSARRRWRRRWRRRRERARRRRRSEKTGAAGK